MSLNADEVIHTIEDRRGLTLDAAEKRDLRATLAWLRSSGFQVTEAEASEEEDTPQPANGVDGLLYEAWGVIANAPYPAWDTASQEAAEWREAAERWRDRWHAYLRWAHPGGQERG